jgi:hypothetical protein
MKNPNRTTIKAGQDSKRSFNWGIKAAEINFMEPSGWESAMEGSSTCDCGSALSRVDKPRQKRPTRKANQ